MQICMQDDDNTDDLQNIALSNPDAFNCCSHYRSCSDAKRCLIPEASYSLHCSYRKSLESGVIFYGKNANGFSDYEYRNFCKALNALPDDTLAEYLKVIVYTHYESLGASNILWDSSSSLQKLTEAGLCDVSECGIVLLEKYNVVKLRKMLLLSDFGTAWKMCRPDELPGDEAPPKKNTAEFLYSWIKKNAQSFIWGLTEKYRFISIPDSLRKYSYECYYDNLRGHEKEYYYETPLERNEDGLFKKGV